MKKVERWVKSWARVHCVKGDRRVVDVARAFANKDIIRLLETYEQISEFVCSTFACDLTRMIETLALGGGGFALQLSFGYLKRKHSKSANLRGKVVSHVSSHNYYF